jgi:16S rRNA (guanine966-N2)-methyltransferase
MSVKVLGGFARGHNIETLNSDITRPTSVMLRRKLFDSHQNLTGINFWDICAGSGSVGLEALSRGADHVLFNEVDFRAHKVLKKNIDTFKDKYKLSNFSIFKDSFSKLLTRSTLDEDSEYILFFDPPYEKLKLYEEFFDIVEDLRFNGLIVVEACTQKTMSIKDFEAKFSKADKIYKQGTSFFALFRKG